MDNNEIDKVDCKYKDLIKSSDKLIQESAILIKQVDELLKKIKEEKEL